LKTLTKGTPRLKPTPPYAETNSKTTGAINAHVVAHGFDLPMLKTLNHVAF
jgi:hypothetical protein